MGFGRGSALCWGCSAAARARKEREERGCGSKGLPQSGLKPVAISGNQLFFPVSARLWHLVPTRWSALCQQTRLECRNLSSCPSAMWCWCGTQWCKIGKGLPKKKRQNCCCLWGRDCQLGFAGYGKLLYTSSHSQTGISVPESPCSLGKQMVWERANQERLPCCACALPEESSQDPVAFFRSPFSGAGEAGGIALGAAAASLPPDQSRLVKSWHGHLNVAV